MEEKLEVYCYSVDRLIVGGFFEDPKNPKNLVPWRDRQTNNEKSGPRGVL